MPLPATYNTTTVAVDPNMLNTSVTALTNACNNINNALSDIINSLSGLRLAWTGDSAQVAHDFNNRWEFAMGELFGTQGDPAAGILNILTGGVAQAAANYANNEGSIAQMWNGFEQKLLQKGGAPQDATDSPTGTPNPNYHTTSVNETGV